MLAGIDVGTTGCKCSVYSREGILKREAYEEYPAGQEKNSGRELDPASVWSCVKKVMKETAQKGESWEAVGVTSFGEAVVLLDSHDQPVMNTLLYTDERGAEQCRKLVHEIGLTYLQKVTGLNPHEQYSISKLMWIRENCPEKYHQAKKIFLYAGYIVYMLTSEHVTDYSLASRTMAFDIHRCQWDKKILEAAGIEEEKLPRPLPTGTIAGVMREELKQELGITGKAAVTGGCHDQVAAAAGVGALKNGDAVNGSGTVECITPVFAGEKDGGKMMEGNYCTVPYMGQNTFVTYAYSLTGGALLKWFRDKLSPMEAAEFRKMGKDPYHQFNQMIREEPSGLLILPHFAGSATPYMDSHSVGAVVGLTVEIGKDKIYQALMEAVAFEMRVNLEYLERADIYVKNLYACGGGARSNGWMQIKADILGIPICSLGDLQAGTAGCVMMAGTAAGVYENMEAAAEVFHHEGKWFYPEEKRREKYNIQYQKYRKMYQAVKEVLA